MDLSPMTRLELEVLSVVIGDLLRQLYVLTGGVHGRMFTEQELERLRHIYEDIVELDQDVRLLTKQWRERVEGGQVTNRSDTGRTDAAGSARPGDDVPPSTTR